MLTSQLRSEWMRGRGRPVEKYVGALAIVMGAIVPVIMVLMGWRNPIIRANALRTLTFPKSLDAVRAGVGLFGPFFAAALGANIVGAEYQYGTWPWLLVRSDSRLRILAVKGVTLLARIVALTTIAVAAFVAIAALVRVVLGYSIAEDAVPARALLIPFISAAGAMLFGAAVGLVVTVASRSVTFGTLTGALTLPLLAALRFKETAAWIPYVHLDNLTTRLLTGEAPMVLKRVYDFEMSAQASAAILALELGVLLSVAYAIFRKQEIVY